MNELLLSEKMPVLALRGLTVFPGATMHFDVGREKSIRALDKAMSDDQRIFLVTQKNISDGRMALCRNVPKARPSLRAISTIDSDSKKSVIINMT